MLPTADLATLHGSILRIADVGEEAADALVAVAAPRSVASGEAFLREGDVANHVAFVLDGVLRYYYLADGTEHTGQFFFPGQWVTDIASFSSRRPSLQTIEAMAPSRVLTVHHADLERLYREIPVLERLGRRVAEGALAHSQARTASLLIRRPEDRYRALVAERPRVMEEIPLYVIASYLGVVPESLSRIRARIGGGDERPS